VQRQKITAVKTLRGLQAPSQMTIDQRVEVERVLSKALLELTGELEGEYYPLATSCSYPARPGGMTAEEEHMLESKSLLFKKTSGDVSGQGVYANNAGDIAAWINEEGHVRFLVCKSGPEGVTKLNYFVHAVAMALKQDGYDLA